MFDDPFDEPEGIGHQIQEAPVGAGIFADEAAGGRTLAEIRHIEPHVEHFDHRLGERQADRLAKPGPPARDQRHHDGGRTKHTGKI
jgi:hypothetical protein